MIFPWDNSNECECRAKQSISGKCRNLMFSFGVLIDLSNLKIQMYCPTHAVSVMHFAFPTDFVLAGYCTRSGWLLL